MDFSLSEEQQLLKDSVQRFIREGYALESRRKLVATDIGYSEKNWAKMAELGWLALSLPEEYGGIGGDAQILEDLMEEAGAHLLCSPFLSTAVMAASLISASSDHAS